MKNNAYNRAYEAAVVKSILQPYVEERVAEIVKMEQMTHQYSETVMQRIECIMHMKEVRQSRKYRGRRLAAGCLAAALLAGVTCIAAEPICEKIAGAFLKKEEGMVFVGFDGTSDDGVTAGDLYIPDGFTRTYILKREQSMTCGYENDTGEWFYVCVQPYREQVDMQYAYRMETFTAESVEKGGREYLILRPTAEAETSAVMWAESGDAFCIESTLPESELLKIAAGITVDSVIFED